MQGEREIFKFAEAISTGGVSEYAKRYQEVGFLGEMVLNNLWDVGLSYLMQACRDCGLKCVKRSAKQLRYGTNFENSATAAIVKIRNQDPEYIRRKLIEAGYFKDINPHQLRLGQTLPKGENE